MFMFLEIRQIKGNFKDVMMILKLMSHETNEWHPSEIKGWIRWQVNAPLSKRNKTRVQGNGDVDISWRGITSMHRHHLTIPCVIYMVNSWQHITNTSHGHIGSPKSNSYNTRTWILF
jgi:hypothetical protein